MGKNITILVFIQLSLAIISAVLISKMSFLGRVGISLMYKQYTVFKTPWKTALIIFGIQVALIIILALFKYFSSRPIANMVTVVLLIIGVIGAYYTYIDFTRTSHKHMKFYFHLGGYMFWFNWIFSCLFFFCLKGKRKALPLSTTELDQPDIQPKID